MYQFLCELLADPLGLDMAAVWEYGILAVIALAVFLVGREMLPGGTEDMVFQGCVRLGVFAVLWAVAYTVIALAQWVLLNWVLALAIGAVAAIGLFVLFILIKGFVYSI